jgi:hypothetical protein
MYFDDIEKYPFPLVCIEVGKMGIPTICLEKGNRRNINWMEEVLIALLLS